MPEQFVYVLCGDLSGVPCVAPAARTFPRTCVPLLSVCVCAGPCPSVLPSPTSLPPAPCPRYPMSMGSRDENMGAHPASRAIRPWSPASRWMIYLVIPLGVSTVLIAMYFSGVPLLQHIVTPEFEGLHPDSNREFGLLENLQNVCLLIMVITAGIAVRNKESRLEKAAFLGIALFSLFVFLEELDYGLHFYEMAFGVHSYDAAEVRNIHNTYDLTNPMKHGALIGMMLLFVIFPLAFAESNRPLIRYITPDRFAIFTMVVMFLTRTLAHTLRDAGFGSGGSISHNISEFRELTTYYLFTVYLVDLVFRREYSRCMHNEAGEPANSAKSGTPPHGLRA